MKRILRKVLPQVLHNNLTITKERQRLSRLKPISFEPAHLRKIDPGKLTTIMNSDETASKWRIALQKLEPFGLGQSIKGGINLGDRQALYHLMHYLKPKSVLEIGTHVGASTSVIALALSELATDDEISCPSLVTVDIRNVNDESLMPWTHYGASHSPKDVLKGLDCEHLVEFALAEANTFFNNTQQQFDFVFLDGDHSANAVYNEIPAAMSCLNTNGTILLHDVFPNLKPLWSNGTLIPGPWLGVQRLCSENSHLDLLPLGELPWATKLNSNVTSLALLVKQQR